MELKLKFDPETLEAIRMIMREELGGIKQTDPAPTPAAPVAPTPPTPATVTQPVQPPAPITPPAPVQPPVATATPAYTVPQLQQAAVTLMDKGVDITAILAKFGVSAVTLLPEAQYGAFALELRNQGAMI